MDRLVELYGETTDFHPVARAAWLHHQFVRIHPFEDGNGRVARALTLLVLLQNRFAPLVVEGRRRGEYIEALDAANDGDLNQLIRLFADLESVALRAELAPQPSPLERPSIASEVAQAHVQRLVSLRRANDAEVAERASALAVEVQKRIGEFLDREAAQLRDDFAAVDPTVDARTRSSRPGDAEARYWYRQLVRTAKAVDFFTNLSDGSWWTQLRLRVDNKELRYVAAVQKIGRGETGALALTVFAELVPREVERKPDREPEPDVPEPETAFTPTTADSVTFVLSDALDERWPEAAELLERTLALAVDKLGRGLTA
jgi:hypothetical protein